jgi:predicted NAD/FAD-binding protein
MKIAIVGSGISGLMTARLLSPTHEVTLYEANEWVGGHTHTIDVDVQGRTFNIDTGFIIFNERAYPGFISLLDALGVRSRGTEMSFSVVCDSSGLEYGSRSLTALFAQRRNVIRPRFLRLLRQTSRFNREAREFLDRPDDQSTLREFLSRGRYPHEFRDWYIVPMCGSIWSATKAGILDFPALSLFRFLSNHGLLASRPILRWRVIEGGSARYVEALLSRLKATIHTNTPVTSVIRERDHVSVVSRVGRTRFDYVVLACHSDQALGLLSAPTPAERHVLGSIPYEENETVLHTDTRMMPRRQDAWASWNYRTSQDAAMPVSVTYDMNRLQRIADAPVRFLVTLNRTHAIDPSRIIARMTYHHPQYNRASIRAQQSLPQIQGQHRTFFCGAYWGYGFHEDGVQSALSCANAVQRCVAVTGSVIHG